MLDIIIGEKIINLLGEVGIIISSEGEYIQIEYQTRVAKTVRWAFESGLIKYLNTELQSKVDEKIEGAKQEEAAKEEARRIAEMKFKEAHEKASYNVHYGDSIYELEYKNESLYERGCELLDSNVKCGMSLIARAAKNGFVEAQLYLGGIYSGGIIVKQNLAKAFKWYLCAAEKGEQLAQYTVAEMYEDGKGVEKNFEKSLEWYKRAAEGGNHRAIDHLGHMYYYGNGVEQSYEEAYYWFDKDGFRWLPYYICSDMYFHVEKAYEHALKLYLLSYEQDGYEGAGYDIGKMYYYGLGVEQDYGKAFEFLYEYYELCCDYDRAEPELCYMLGEMYKNGWGVEQNLEEAEKLLAAAEKVFLWRVESEDTMDFDKKISKNVGGEKFNTVLYSETKILCS